MKCYVLEKGSYFNLEKCKQEEISAELEGKINAICSAWQVRDLRQSGSSQYDDDGITSSKEYEPLEPTAFVITDGELVGYYANHFNVTCYVNFVGNEKTRLGDYDYSDYTGGTHRVNRGHVAIVPRPDTDTNPYYDEPRFHSQEEYDDYIKWRD